MNEILMGKHDIAWRMGEVVTVTLCVTEACNLACRYCYMLHKNNRKEMSLETGKQIIDYIPSGDMPIDDDSIVLEFIGGEPTLCIELISQLCDYFIVQMYQKKHKWFNNYRFNFSSNGLLYSSERVQNFLARHKGHISFGISLDGTKEKHDMSRVKPNGTGSYDDVFKNVGLWIKQFAGHSTKATFAHDDISFIKDSVIHLWNSGINNVMANIVFEDVWEPGDERIFEEQLNQLADYIVDHNLWYTHSVRFFSPQLGLPSATDIIMCGAGRKMIAFDTSGDIFPCTRFFDFCLNNEFTPIGSVHTGFDHDRLRPFQNIKVSDCMDKECKRCMISNGCYHCLGNNYNFYKTIYQKPMYGCEMHKANVRANNRLWYLYSKINNCTSPITQNKVGLKNNNILKFLYIITSDSSRPVCAYKNNLNSNKHMSSEMLLSCLDYCFKHHIAPVFIGDSKHGLTEDSMYFSITDRDESSKNHATVYNDDKDYKSNNIILTIQKSEIGSLNYKLTNIQNKTARVNIFISNVKEWDDADFVTYYQELIKIIKMIDNKQIDLDITKINLFKTLLPSESRCGAGRTSIAIAPNGKFYICPAFYFDYKGDASIGNIENDFKFLPIDLLCDERLPLCNKCENACNVCVYNNIMTTGELNIPSVKQCRLQNINRAVFNK